MCLAERPKGRVARALHISAPAATRAPLTHPPLQPLSRPPPVTMVAKMMLLAVSASAAVTSASAARRCDGAGGNAFPCASLSSAVV